MHREIPSLPCLNQATLLCIEKFLNSATLLRPKECPSPPPPPHTHTYTFYLDLIKPLLDRGMIPLSYLSSASNVGTVQLLSLLSLPCLNSATRYHMLQCYFFLFVILNTTMCCIYCMHVYDSLLSLYGGNKAYIYHLIIFLGVTPDFYL